MNAVKDQVERLVEIELAAANEKYPAFHSAHEGYAVILEEAEEALAEIQIVQEHLGRAWAQIKGNRVAHVEISKAMRAAVNLSCEAIQIAAMAQKYQDMENAPTADAISAVRWEKIEQQAAMSLFDVECASCESMGFKFDKYCANCGSRMDAEDKHGQID